MMQHLTDDQLVDFVRGELSPQDDARVHGHLAACAACRHETDAERALIETLRAAAVADEREMPSAIKAAVWQEIRAAKPGPFAALAGFLRPVIAVPIAARLLLGVVVSPLVHHGSRPTVAASYYLQAHAAQSAQGPLSERVTTPTYEAGVAANGQTSLANAYDGGYPATAAYGGGR